MSLIQINTNPTRRELRQFAGIWFPAFFAVVCSIAYRRTHSLNIVASIAVCAFAISLIGLIAPRLMKPIFVGWMYASFPIGFVVSHIVIGAIFFLVITPIGLIMRLIGRDAMYRNFDRQAATYWVAHDPGLDRARYLRQF
jgi:uncharacterized membrane protein